MRTVAAGALALEGAAGVAAGAGFAIAALVADPSDRTTTIVLGVLLALYGAAVLAVARGVWRHSAWARTPAFLVQFFGLVVAWYQRHTLVAVTVLLGAVSLVAVVALVLAEREPDRSP
jgi:hypothetical protein